MRLDLIENIEIHKGITPINNWHSIWHLKEGLFMCYNHFNHLEKNYWELKNPEATESKLKILKKTRFSLNTDLSQIDSQIMNLYHWYSINLMNYAKCCGLIKFLNKEMILPENLSGNKEKLSELKRTQEEYISSIPELNHIKHFRNKAGAHLAFTDPRFKDNPATILDSMALLTTVENGKIYVGGYTRERGNSKSSFSEHKWNLADNFNSLIGRYFKENIQ